jgi:hypothetical protein
VARGAVPTHRLVRPLEDLLDRPLVSADPSDEIAATPGKISVRPVRGGPPGPGAGPGPARQRGHITARRNEPVPDEFRLQLTAHGGDPLPQRVQCEVPSADQRVQR